MLSFLLLITTILICLLRKSFSLYDWICVLVRDVRAPRGITSADRGEKAYFSHPILVRQFTDSRSMSDDVTHDQRRLADHSLPRL